MRPLSPAGADGASICVLCPSSPLRAPFVTSLPAYMPVLSVHATCCSRPSVLQALLEPLLLEGNGRGGFGTGPGADAAMLLPVTTAILSNNKLLDLVVRARLLQMVVAFLLLPTNTAIMSKTTCCSCCCCKSCHRLRWHAAGVEGVFSARAAS